MKSNDKIPYDKLPKSKKHRVKFGSREYWDLSLDEIDIVNLNARQASIKASEGYGTDSFFSVEEPLQGPVQNKIPKIPDDIVFEKTDVLYNNKLESARYTIRMKNTSGQKIIGIDARVTEK